MFIVCEKCSSQYGVSEKAIGENGREVKCSSCGHTWHQMPIYKQSDADVIEEAIGEAKEIPEGSNLPSTKVKKAGKLMKASFTLLFLAAIISGLLANHSFAKFLGMEDTSGILFKEFKVQKKRVENKLEFKLIGTIVNDADDIRRMPHLVATIVSNAGHPMDVIEFDPPQELLLPGEQVPFEKDITGISGNADTVVLDMGNSWELWFRK